MLTNASTISTVLEAASAGDDAAPRGTTKEYSVGSSPLTSSSAAAAPDDDDDDDNNDDDDNDPLPSPFVEPPPPPTAPPDLLLLPAAREEDNDDAYASSHPSRSASRSLPNASAAQSAYAHQYSISSSPKSGFPSSSSSSSLSHSHSHSWPGSMPRPSSSSRPPRSGTMGSHHSSPPLPHWSSSSLSSSSLRLLPAPPASRRRRQRRPPTDILPLPPPSPSSSIASSPSRFPQAIAIPSPADAISSNAVGTSCHGLDGSIDQPPSPPPSPPAPSRTTWWSFGSNDDGRGGWGAIPVIVSPRPRPHRTSPLLVPCRRSSSSLYSYSSYSIGRYLYTYDEGRRRASSSSSLVLSTSMSSSCAFLIIWSVEDDRLGRLLVGCCVPPSTGSHPNSRPRRSLYFYLFVALFEPPKRQVYVLPHTFRPVTSPLQLPPSRRHHRSVGC